MREIIGKNKSVALSSLKLCFRGGKAMLLLQCQYGQKTNTPTTDIINPPIVPAANGNQNPSFSAPTIKGMNPKTVEATVRKIDIIFVFHAFT